MHNLKQAEIAMMKEFREMRQKEEDPFTRRKSRPTLVTKVKTSHRIRVTYWSVFSDRSVYYPVLSCKLFSCYLN